MARRLFRCGYCHHRLRIATETCSACGGRAPLLNRPSLYIGVIGAAIALAMVLRLASV